MSRKRSSPARPPQSFPASSESAIRGDGYLLKMSSERHAVIAGTGRAGTSFLVEFLAACGLDTGEGGWSERARAGFEHHLASGLHLPYVVKDPWLFAYCEQLDLEAFQFDALVVPIRDLAHVARSRIHQERLAFADTWFGDLEGSQVVGVTPGGVLYSLDVVDQGRILAVGLHRLLHWAVARELPLFLLSFPRLVEDVDYLTRTLWPWLGGHCTIETAREAFARTARDAVRIREPQPSAPLVLGPGEPDPAVLDRAALLERRDELQRELAHAQAELQEMRDSPLFRLADTFGRHAWIYRPARAVARLLAG